MSANGAILVLQDEDSTNSIKGEWKHVNTLDHYKVHASHVIFFLSAHEFSFLSSTFVLQVQDGSSLRLAGPQIMVQNFSSGIFMF